MFLNRIRLHQTMRKLLLRVSLGLAVLVLGASNALAQTLYSIGDPTDEEQLFVELVNRAREDAVAEAERLAASDDEFILSAIAQFGVDLDLMIEQFTNDLERSLPPLAINSRLQDMAYLHSLDQFENVFQSHTSSNGDSIGDRATNVGYDWNLVAENTYSYSFSVEYGHAGFQIDWGDGEGGMQTPPGHRLNIHNAEYREIGVGVVEGYNESSTDEVGPMVVTQNFGRQFDDVPLLTGVVFDDTDGDGFYDLGEGVGGVEIRVAGNDYYAETANSGGYTIPLSAAQDGTYNVIVVGDGFSTETTVTVQNLENVKLDIIPSSLTQEEISEFVEGLFPNAVFVSEGWAFDEGFGLFFTESEPWLYHATMGWVYAQSAGSAAGVYLYSENLGWLWTASDTFPYLYHVESGSWLAYSATSDSTRWLYDFTLEQWVSWDSFVFDQ